MKEKTILLLVVLIFSLNGFSQPAIQWQKCLGGTAYDAATHIEQTTDGGYIVGGLTNSTDGDVSGNHGIYDYWLVKLDVSGNIQWQKCLGGTMDDEALCVRQTAEGGYIAAGFAESNDGDVSGNHGSWDYWIVKTDSNGNILWQKCFGGTSSEPAASIQETFDGGYIVAGHSGSYDGDVTGNHGIIDYWLLKIDSSGNIQWQKCLGGTDFDLLSYAEQTIDGGFVAAGYTLSDNGDVSGHHLPVEFDCWVVKLDSGATIQWQKCLGGMPPDRASEVRQTFDGGYIVSAVTYSNDGDVSGNHGGNDYWIVKLDSSGNIQWQKCLGGTDSDYAGSIRQTMDSGYVITGNTKSNNGDVTGNHGLFDSWFVKLDSNGNIQWQKCLGGTGHEDAYSLELTTDGGYILAGQTYSNDGDVSGNHGDSDFWIVKLSAPVGIEENNHFSEINIFPNPATSEFRIKNSELKIQEIEIYDVLGKLIFSQQLTANSQELIINVSSLPKGIYFVRLTDEHGSKATGKFVKM